MKEEQVSTLRGEMLGTERQASDRCSSGQQSRLSTYVGVDRGTRQPENGKHGEWLTRENVTMNLRCFAVFKKAKPKNVTEDKKEARTALRKQLGAKPPDRSPCPGCGRLIPNHVSRAPIGILLLETGRRRWECEICYKKPTSKLKSHASLVS